MAYMHETDARTLIRQLASVRNHTYKLQSVPENTEPATNDRINITVRCTSKTENPQTQEMMLYKVFTCGCAYSEVTTCKSRFNGLHALNRRNNSQLTDCECPQTHLPPAIRSQKDKPQTTAASTSESGARAKQETHKHM